MLTPAMSKLMLGKHLVKIPKHPSAKSD